VSFGEWLEDRLFERRIVVVTGRLDDDAAARAAAALLALDALGERSIELHLSVADATLDAAFVLIERWTRSIHRCACSAAVGSGARRSA
jgi:hypothetical protein